MAYDVIGVASLKVSVAMCFGEILAAGCCCVMDR